MRIEAARRKEARSADREQFADQEGAAGASHQMYGNTDDQVDVLRISEARHAKFHDLIVIEPADCRQAAKTGRFKLGGKDYLFEMNVRRSVIVDLVGGLDNNDNC